MKGRLRNYLKRNLQNNEKKETQESDNPINKTLSILTSGIGTHILLQTLMIIIICVILVVIIIIPAKMVGNAAYNAGNKISSAFEAMAILMIFL